MLTHRWSYFVRAHGLSAISRAILLGSVAAILQVGCGSSTDNKAAGLASACSINSDCAPPLACSFGKCHAACRVSSDCETGQLCIENQGVGVCQLSSESSCKYRSDCNEPLICAVDGHCRNQCKQNVDCLSGQVCTPSGSCAEQQELGSNGDLTVARTDGGTPLGAGGAGNGGTKSDTGGMTSVGGQGGIPITGHDGGVNLGGFGPGGMPGSGGFMTGSGGFGPGGMPGAGGFGPGCGTISQPCCGGNTCTDSNSVCVFGQCQACGAVSQQCCTNDVCDSGATCSNNVCVACGAIGQACCGSTCNGGLSCLSGKCDVTCTAPLVARSGVCVVPAPRPISPISGSKVSSKKPSLSWELPAGIATAHVDVCADRNCNTIESSSDVSGSSTVLANGLPYGVSFIRFRSVLAADAGSASFEDSPIWQIEVGGTHDAPLQTAWGVVPDFDGDGHADALASVTLSQGSATRVYSGSVTGLSSPQTISSSGPIFGGSFPVGDFNGDGYTDVALMGGPGYQIYFGSNSGLGASTQSMNLPSNTGGSGASAIGDFNRDGYADLVVPGAQNDGQGNNFLVLNVFRGGPTGFVITPSSTVTTVLYQPPQASLDSGDFNGDGFTDVVFVSPKPGGGNQTVSMFKGSASGLVATPINTMIPSGTDPAFALSTAGDMNGDGYDDVLVVGKMSAAVYFGSSNGVSATSTSLSGGSPMVAGPSMSLVLGLGDVNADGYDDVALVTNNQPDVRVYLGSGTTFTTVTLSPAPPVGFTPSMVSVDSLSALGDVNGDHSPDVGIAVTWTDTQNIKNHQLYAFGANPVAAITTLPVNVSLVR